MDAIQAVFDAARGPQTLETLALRVVLHTRPESLTYAQGVSLLAAVDRSRDLNVPPDGGMGGARALLRVALPRGSTADSRRRLLRAFFAARGIDLPPTVGDVVIPGLHEYYIQMFRRADYLDSVRRQL